MIRARGVGGTWTPVSANQWGQTRSIEDQVDAGAAPFRLISLAITAFKQLFVCSDCLPGGAHIEQVHEEVIAQRLGVVRRYRV